MGGPNSNEGTRHFGTLGIYVLCDLAGQWMTERRGGSDVGQGTETVAVQQVRLCRSNRAVTVWIH